MKTVSNRNYMNPAGLSPNLLKTSTSFCTMMPANPSSPRSVPLTPLGMRDMPRSPTNGGGRGASDANDRGGEEISLVVVDGKREYDADGLEGFRGGAWGAEKCRFGDVTSGDAGDIMDAAIRA